MKQVPRHFLQEDHNINININNHHQLNSNNINPQQQITSSQHLRPFHIKTEHDSHHDVNIINQHSPHNNNPHNLHHHYVHSRLESLPSNNPHFPEWPRADSYPYISIPNTSTTQFPPPPVISYAAEILEIEIKVSKYIVRGGTCFWASLSIPSGPQLFTFGEQKILTSKKTTIRKPILHQSPDEEMDLEFFIEKITTPTDMGGPVEYPVDLANKRTNGEEPIRFRNSFKSVDVKLKLSAEQKIATGDRHRYRLCIRVRNKFHQVIGIGRSDVCTVLRNNIKKSSTNSGPTLALSPPNSTSSSTPNTSGNMFNDREPSNMTSSSSTHGHGHSHNHSPNSTSSGGPMVEGDGSGVGLSDLFEDVEKGLLSVLEMLSKAQTTQSEKSNIKKNNKKELPSSSLPILSKSGGFILPETLLFDGDWNAVVSSMDGSVDQVFLTLRLSSRPNHQKPLINDAPAKNNNNDNNNNTTNTCRHEINNNNGTSVGSPLKCPSSPVLSPVSSSGMNTSSPTRDSGASSTRTTSTNKPTDLQRLLHHSASGSTSTSGNGRSLPSLLASPPRDQDREREREKDREKEREKETMSSVYDTNKKRKDWPTPLDNSHPARHFDSVMRSPTPPSPPTPCSSSNSSEAAQSVTSLLDLNGNSAKISFTKPPPLSVYVNGPFNVSLKSHLPGAAQDLFGSQLVPELRVMPSATASSNALFGLGARDESESLSSKRNKTEALVEMNRTFSGECVHLMLKITRSCGPGEFFYLVFKHPSSVSRIESTRISVLDSALPLVPTSSLRDEHPALERDLSLRGVFPAVVPCSGGFRKGQSNKREALFVAVNLPSVENLQLLLKPPQGDSIVLSPLLLWTSDVFTVSIPDNLLEGNYSCQLFSKSHDCGGRDLVNLTVSDRVQLPTNGNVSGTNAGVSESGMVNCALEEGFDGRRRRSLPLPNHCQAPPRFGLLSPTNNSLHLPSPFSLMPSLSFESITVPSISFEELPLPPPGSP
eukprot:TRINITY_DN6231_c0_g1_i1.p1 TRINITY_DN6231_c0_g1~~TRINITY_DN6231_c0_g1_i1.p1  ORF type:complete len:989 (-),score=223.85 TRINITY_DN6231_c0_g1_i1:159-3125(-)